jgi:hypothetical protein
MHFLQDFTSCHSGAELLFQEGGCGLISSAITTRPLPSATSTIPSHWHSTNSTSLVQDAQCDLSFYAVDMQQRQRGMARCSIRHEPSGRRRQGLNSCVFLLLYLESWSRQLSKNLKLASNYSYSHVTPLCARRSPLHVLSVCRPDPPRQERHSLLVLRSCVQRRRMLTIITFSCEVTPAFNIG